MHYDDSVQNPSTEDTPSIKDMYRGLGTAMYSKGINSITTEPEVIVAA